MANQRNVSELTLLQGAFHAMRNAGLLLTSAAALYETKQYSGSLILASFSREEIGKSEILIGLRKKALSGENISVTQVRNASDNHASKMIESRAGIHTLLSGTEQEKYGKALDPSTVDWNNPEERALYAEWFQAITERAELVKEKASGQMYKKRVSLLYVDLNEDGETWNLPEEVTAGTACYFISMVAADYNLRSNKLRNEYGAQWKDHPEFPEAVYLKPPLPK
ncbi:AbiV family abortive infection protein [bacterium]|nr:AbiV family abortive infection protein [bacterium]